MALFGRCVSFSRYLGKAALHDSSLIFVYFQEGLKADCFSAQKISFKTTLPLNG